MRPETLRILLEAFIIVTLGVMIGLSVNYRLMIDVLSGDAGNVPSSGRSGASIGYPVPVELEEARTLLSEDALAVDARASEMYAEGHLPGAYSLPLMELEEELPDFRKRIPFDRTLVVYCSGYGCSDSFDLAQRLIKEGYGDVRVFEGGIPAWRDAGLSVAGEGG